MKTKFIVNPIAGRGHAVKAWQRIRPILASIIPDLEWELTRGPAHAVEIASAAKEQGFEAVVVLGGDGTVNEVMNGLAGGKTALAIIPAGTGNDFARTLGLPSDPVTAARQFPHWQVSRIDLGQMNGRYFINMGGLGFDAAVAARVNQGSLLKGKAAYLAAIFQTLASFKAIRAEIVIDGHEIKKDMLLIAVGNAQYVGGGIKMLPLARPDDGLLDVCIAEHTTRADILKTLPLLYRGRHLGHPKCFFYQGKKVEVRVSPQEEQQIWAHLDGQEARAEQYSFSIIPGALSVLRPFSE